MFALCEGMKWNHLPGNGLLHDQDPMLMDAFRLIFSERGKHQENERKAQERKSKRGGGGKVAGRR